jgi:RNA recognition motif-containing protein
MNIYVGNLARTVTEDQLRDLFAQKGEVTSVKIIVDKFTGEKRGFGFVDMPNPAEAQLAITELNGYELDRSSIRVNEARPAEARGPRPGGDRFGGDRGGSRGGSSQGGGWGSRPPKRF